VEDPKENIKKKFLFAYRRECFLHRTKLRNIYKNILIKDYDMSKKELDKIKSHIWKEQD
jgi:hypothetical protein